jgi:demethylmenaquinone methyltransferase/2-methoxy-6-polyprenyl-1,4-benzoquinol methylase
MLQECQQKIIASNTSFIQAPAEALPDLDNKIDKAIICFGIRNFTDPALALKSVYEKMRNGGKVVILEFNPPVSSQIPSTYSNYIRNVLPRLGKKLVGDEYSYQYLSDSIQKEPSPENRRECLRQAGFEMINYLPLSLGILGLFEAYKY